MTRAAFVYPNPRRALVAEIERGDAPDSTLLGQNHLSEHGIDARVHDPRLARERSSWLRWQLRELVLPFELRDVDVVVTPLFRYAPTVARATRGPRFVVVNFGLNVLLRNTKGARRAAVAAVLRAATRIVCLSELQRHELLELTGFSKSTIVTTELGIDAAFFTPRPDPDEASVLTVGKDLARDFSTFADAMRALDVPAHVAALPRSLLGIELPANVTTSVMGPLELRDAYARAGCVVIAQHRDDHPVGTEHGGTTALLEAMAMGKAIVLTDRAVLHEYVSDGDTALVVPPEDPQALREAVARVLADGELRRRLGAAARARVEEAFTTRHLAARLAPVVREAAS